MPRRPVIGIPMQTLAVEPDEQQPSLLMWQSYVEELRKAGAVPWLIPLLPHDPETLHEVFERLDGVFLAGGVDVDPASYGESRTPLCGRSDPDRDAVEIALVRHAVEKHLPLFAICRGIQILNVACGGTLYQDVRTQVPAALKHDHFSASDPSSRKVLVHEVTVKGRSRLGQILGETLLSVNSIHHQAIKTLAPNLVATAYAPDGIIEGVEGTDSPFLIAVQWHPEELADTHPGMARLFTSFIAAATGSR